MNALVTGASRGIGKAIAEHLARAGYRVTGTAREPETVPSSERVEGMRLLPLDLGDEQSIDTLIERAGPIDVLVNNAGRSQIGPLEEVPPEKLRGLFQVNLFGTLRLTQGILPGMRERRSGRIIGIASFAAVTPLPFLSVYAGTKAALVAIYKGMRHEVAPWGIAVSVVAPFNTRTTIQPDVVYGERSAYRPMVDRVRQIRERFIAAGADPEAIAADVVRLLRARRPRFFVPSGKNARLTSLLTRILPESFVESGVRRQFGLPRN